MIQRPFCQEKRWLLGPSRQRNLADKKGEKVDEEGRKGHVEETKWSFYLVKAYFYKVKAML